MSKEKINPPLPEMLVNYVLELEYQQKIELLEDSYEQGIGVFTEVSQIFLDAPGGEGGGLSTEVIDEVLFRLIKK
jgi:hypothetical protein